MLTCLHRSLSIYVHSYLTVSCDDNDDDYDDDDELFQSYKATKLQRSRLEINGQSIDQDCHQCRCCITSRS